MERKSIFKLLFYLFVILPCGQGAKGVEYQIGIMKFSSSDDTPNTNNTLDVCFNYPSEFFTVPTVLTKSYSFQNLTYIDICNGGTNAALDALESVSNETVIVMRYNESCEFSEYAEFAEKTKAGLVLVSSNYIENITSSYNLSVFALIGNKTEGKIHSFQEQNGNVTLQVKFVTAEDKLFNPTVLILWALAVFCVAVGSYIGPYRVISSASEQRILDSSGTPTSSKSEVTMNVLVTLILVVFITSTLLLLYFFYKYLVYFFMAVFCFATARATYDLWLQVLKYFNMDSCTPRIKGYSIHRIILLLVCVAVPIVWFVFRHKTLGWVLQDYLGVCFCIHLIQTLRMPNLKICTILLSLLFVYDIFFVFITPFFTSDGESVMVQVATGGGSGESLPLLLKVPSLGHNILSMCTSTRYSMLGFGDIIVPGFLVCFAHSFDVVTGDTRRRPYFITAMIGYGVGLAIAFVVLTLSQTGQPALFYIVPCTLIPIFLVGLCKRQVKLLWNNPDPSTILSNPITDGSVP